MGAYKATNFIGQVHDIDVIKKTINHQLVLMLLRQSADVDFSLYGGLSIISVVHSWRSPYRQRCGNRLDIADSAERIRYVRDVKV